MSSNKPLKLKRKGYWFATWDEWFESPAYRDLSMPARCLLQEFQHIYRPTRNGQLSISVQKAMKRLGCAKQTAQQAFRELSEHGFIKLRHGERWQERKAREWILTIERLNNHEPTDDWKHWKPGEPVNVLPRKNPKQKQRPRFSPGSECVPELGTNSGQTGSKSTPLYGAATSSTPSTH